MKLFCTLFSALLFLPFSENLKAQQANPTGISEPDFPKFETVVRSFFQKYQYRHRPFFMLQKRPEGWFVLRTDEQQKPVAELELFWSAEGRNYLPQPQFAKPLPIREEDWDKVEEAFFFDDVEPNLKSYIYKFGKDREAYDQQPFYGYRGWYKDVIKLFENQSEQLSNEQLNSLARAYSKAASGLLADNEGFADLTEQFQLPGGQNALTETQVAAYCQLNQKSVAAFQLLHRRDPDFMTPVGPVWTKYSNEIMDGFLNLLYFQNEKTARAQLKPDLYGAYLLQSARNLLNSCPPDAVLVTYGDTDTYPLLYVQATEVFRTDVLVVNHSLLALPRYYRCLKNGVFNAKPLRSNLPERFLAETIYLKTRLAKIDEQTASVFFQELQTAQKLESNPEYVLESAPAATVALSVPGSKTGNEVQWNPNRKTIGLRELALLDMLHANAWKRPLCFSLTCANSTFDEWQGHLALEGIIYRVFSEKLPKTRWGKMTVKTEQSLDIWQHKLKFDVHETVTSYDLAPFFYIQFQAGKALAVQLLEQSDTLNALEIARLLETNFTDEMTARGNAWMEPAHLFGVCQASETAERIGFQILENYLSARLPDYEMENKDILLIELDGLARIYGLDKLKKRLQSVK